MVAFRKFIMFFYKKYRTNVEVTMQTEDGSDITTENDIKIII